MRKYIFIAALAFVAMPMLAQETYENAKISTDDLNGTARYVGMGGAMEALGADISTISSNPAGIGLFRKSMISTSLGVVSQQDGQDFADGNKTNMSFDQIGFVWSSPSEDGNFLNVAFNYHKSRNFDYILSAADGLQNASLNKLTYAKAKNGLLYEVNSQKVPLFKKSHASCTQLDDLFARNLNYDVDLNKWFYDPATSYTLNRAHKGYVGEYDLNLSANVDDRVYLGLTIGLKDVNYRHYGEYSEVLQGPTGIYSLTIGDERKIDGNGANVSAGIIIRPVEFSPFRFGLAITTPTWYDLTSSNYTIGWDNRGFSTEKNPETESYSYKLYTPWKFGLSAGHTIGTILALGASYEYSDYAHLDTRYKTGEYYDYWYDSYYDESESDRVMNEHTKQTLKGVSTLKLGLEYKPDPSVAIRFGYNYVSPMYKSTGFKDGSLSSDGSYYSSATDYTNWKSTNRITCGLGYRVGRMNLDVAYQYSSTNGEFSPFMSYVDKDTAADDNIANAVNVSNKRHQLLFTLGYTF